MSNLIIIGITDCKQWENYAQWFLGEENVEIVKLSSLERNSSDVEKCDGIVLSGGEDVHPKFYGKPEWMKKEEELKLDVNEERDEFELKVIDIAYRKKIPMLGICRGLQIVNVYFKGTLIPDIQGEDRKRHSKNQGQDMLHRIEVKKNSYLREIVSSESVMVNSAHHQAADKIGEGLQVSARAEDGTIEALELKENNTYPFFLLVQWHPERIKYPEKKLASKLKEIFLHQVKEIKNVSE